MEYDTEIDLVLQSKMQIADLKSTFLSSLCAPSSGGRSNKGSSILDLSVPGPTTDWLLNPASLQLQQICIPSLHSQTGNPALGGHFNPRLTTGKLNPELDKPAAITGAPVRDVGKRRLGHDRP